MALSVSVLALALALARVTLLAGTGSEPLMLVKLAKFSAKEQEALREAVRDEDKPGMSNAMKGGLWGTLALPIVGTAVGAHLGSISDDKRNYRIDKLNDALRHHDAEDVKDVLHQDDGEMNRSLKGFLWAGFPGAVAGHMSQEKKDKRNRILRHVLGQSNY